MSTDLVVLALLMGAVTGTGAILLTVAIVLWRRNLLLGLLPSVALVIVVRALGAG